MDNNNWGLLLQNLKEIKQDLNGLEDEIKLLRKDVTIIKVKSGLIGTIAGGITGLIGYVLNK